MVFAAGLGSTGSSALVDLLREFDGIYAPEDEIRFFVDPGGLVNLRDAMTQNWTMFQSQAAIRGYRRLVSQLSRWSVGPYYGLDHSKYFGEHLMRLTEEFLETLSTVDYRGLWYGESSLWRARTNFIAEPLRRRRLNSVRMQFGPALEESEFDQLAADYVKGLVDRLLEKTGSRLLCFNENLSCMFPEKILSMVPGGRIILVVRDPKDVYADSLRVRWLGMPEAFAQYLEWQYAINEGWLRVERRIQEWDPDQRSLLVVRFEDLILDYGRTKDGIMEFLALEASSHVRAFQYLDPEKSRKNIGQWRRVLSEGQARAVDRRMSRFAERYAYEVIE